MKNALKVIALGSALSVTAMAAPSLMGMGFAGQDQDHPDHHEYSQQQAHPEYSKNRYYQVGNREGYEDYQHKMQRKAHAHKYRNDEDHKAHDYGYQQGWQGQSYNNHDHDHDDHR